VLAIGGREKYFTERAEELRSPKKILGSSIWVETNNDTPRKQKILAEVLARLGYNPATVAKAKQSLVDSPGFAPSLLA
jgi:negative regulator of replication initiation